jgi:hypothetical protein
MEKSSDEKSTVKVIRCLNLVHKILGKTESLGIGYLKGLDQLAGGG